MSRRRKAFVQPVEVMVLAFDETEARVTAGQIVQGIGKVIDAVDKGPWDATSGGRRRRVHLNYSTADLYQRPIRRKPR